MQTLLQDLRYALRALRKAPGFAAVVALTLGLGIGANATIFSLINAILLRPPAGVADPAYLVEVYTSDYSGPPFGASSYPDYSDFAANTPELSGLAAYTMEPLNISTGAEAFRGFGAFVSANYFDVLGVTPALGRLFRGGAPASASEAAVVIGYGLWQRRFGGAADVVGRTIRVRGRPVTVIGVAPRGFTGTQTGIGVDLWATLSTRTSLDPSSERSLTDRGSRGLFLVGRLAPGRTASAAQARFDVLAAQLRAAYPEQWTDVRHAPRRITVLEQARAGVLPEIRGAVVSFLGLLSAVAALVLLICSANIASLLLARLTGRAREIAIRLAMGATRARIVRQLLAECTLLALLGGAAGVFLAASAAGLFVRIQPPISIPIVLDVAPDGRALGFASLVAVLTGLCVGLLPALRATRSPGITGLRRNAVTPKGDKHRWLTLRAALVVSQVAVSTVLLVLAALFLQSLEHARSVDLGFRPEHVALATLELDSQGYTAERAGRFYDELEQRVRGLPGVESAAIARSAPLDIDYARRGVRIEGYEPASNEDMEIGVNVVDDGYFKTLSIEILRGRAFTARDRPGARRVAIVSESFASRYWPDGSVAGRTIDFGRGPAEVVGVAADAKYRSIAEDALPYFYVPLRQNPTTSAVLEVRTAGEPSVVLPGLRAQVAALDPDLPVRVETMREHLGVSVLPQRVGSIMLAAFGGVGLLLAALGLYGVLAYLVTARTREIGIRTALGSKSGDVMRMVLAEAASVTAAGLAIGLVAAFAAGRLAAGFLFGVAATDPVTYTAVCGLLTLVALAAAFGPAHRATRIDPVEALRQD